MTPQQEGVKPNIRKLVRKKPLVGARSVEYLHGYFDGMQVVVDVYEKAVAAANPEGSQPSV